MSLGAGTLFANNFEILGVLGEGATGRVYDARRLEEGDEVALKVLQPEFLSDEQIRGRFRREAKVLARIQGPNVCPLLAWGEAPPLGDRDPSLLWLAMPKVEGLALDQLLDREGKLAPDRACDIAIDVLRGLEVVHAAGVIHRDLKPANIMLADRAIVVDFGLAKIVTNEEQQATALTKGNMLFGTPEYMAPEQARGDELSATCDVYAMGIILYQMLTGNAPFEAESALAVLTAQMVEPPASLRSRNPEIPPSLEAVVLRAIEKEEARRYPSARALREALEEVKKLLDSEDVPATRRTGDPGAPESEREKTGRTQPSIPNLTGGDPTDTAPQGQEARRKAGAAAVERAPEVKRRAADPRVKRLLGWAAVVFVGALVGGGAAYVEVRYYVPRSLVK